VIINNTVTDRPVRKA